ncbi:hypothetical protein RUM44_011687 [Polyplax serrata]|uniref:Polynucleotide 5'-hydroxyl-kinase NOL9 n=1 Tax=Polyplax serrata TaxID=468196 RepID=A0ABR1ASH7_POLSC
MNGINRDDSQIKNLKKKKLIAEQCDINMTPSSNKFMQYINTEKYLSVVANPEALKPPPIMFENNFKPKQEIDVDNFLSNILTSRSLNCNINDRFTLIPWIDGQVANSSQQLKKSSIHSSEKGFKEKVNREINCSVSQNEMKPTKRNKIRPFFSETVSDCNNEESDRNIKVLSYADFYEVSSKKAQVLHLHHPCKFSFHGELKLHVVSGNVEVLGCSLSQTSGLNTVDAFSPESCTPLVVESRVGKHKTSIEEIRKNLSNILPKDSISHLIQNYRPYDAILIVEQIVSNLGLIIHKYTNLRLFPKNLEDISSESESLKKLQSTFKFDSYQIQIGIKKNKEWDSVMLKQCTVLCGGKGVGKSTLLKYYVNKSISKGEKVLVLDFDPGQPEFSPPGFLSAVVVDEPLLGPNFTHMKEGIVMTYFGDVNTTQAPNKYLECVKYVIQWCTENQESLKMKWIVNTMGFCKGLGVELMISILKLLNPKDVVQIRSCDDVNNYPFDLTPSVVNKREGFGDITYENNVSYQLWTMNSITEMKNKRKRSDLTPIELRNLMLLAYLTKSMTPPYYNLNSVQPYIVPFSKLYLATDVMLQPNDVLKAFNGNLVSLSVFEHTTEAILSVGPEIDYYKVVIKPKVTLSYGLGFVRGIDCENKKIYIVTHRSAECVQHINCLILGRINLPSFMFVNQETVLGPVAYTSLSTRHEIQRVKRKFRIKTT